MTAIAQKLHPKFIKGSTGKADFVVLSSQEFEELLEDMEDLACMRIAATNRPFLLLS